MIFILLLIFPFTNSVIDYHFLGAFLCAGPAAYAFLLIYMSQQIIYLHSIFGTVLFAKAAADTACFAFLHYIGSLIF